MRRRGRKAWEFLSAIGMFLIFIVFQCPQIITIVVLHEDQHGKNEQAVNALYECYK